MIDEMRIRVPAMAIADAEHIIILPIQLRLLQNLLSNDLMRDLWPPAEFILLDFAWNFMGNSPGSQ